MNTKKLLLGIILLLMASTAKADMAVSAPVVQPVSVIPNSDYGAWSHSATWAGTKHFSVIAPLSKNCMTQINRGGGTAGSGGVSNIFGAAQASSLATFDSYQMVYTGGTFTSNVPMTDLSNTAPPVMAGPARIGGEVDPLPPDLLPLSDGLALMLLFVGIYAILIAMRHRTSR